MLDMGAQHFHADIWCVCLWVLVVGGCRGSRLFNLGALGPPPLDPPWPDRPNFALFFSLSAAMFASCFRFRGVFSCNCVHGSRPWTCDTSRPVSVVDGVAPPLFLCLGPSTLRRPPTLWGPHFSGFGPTLRPPTRKNTF